MRRIICACLAALLLLTAGIASLAEELDLSGLTLEQLYGLRDEVEEKISELESSTGPLYYEDGCYHVGVDLPEGDYALVEWENAMFASVVVRAGDSAEDALILHKLVSGQADIHLEKDTWVTLMEVRAWPLGMEPSAAAPDGSVGEGAYLVGSQLVPGRYIAAPVDKAPLSSYSIFSGILGTCPALMRLQILQEALELTLEEGEYIELSGCTLSPAE